MFNPFLIALVVWYFSNFGAAVVTFLVVLFLGLIVRIIAGVSGKR